MFSGIIPLGVDICAKRKQLLLTMILTKVLKWMQILTV